MADRDLDRSEAAKTGEARVPGPGQDRPPRVPRQQPPSGTRDGSSPEVPGPQPELPDAFAPGLPLSADADPALDGAGAEPSDAGDPYGPPGDLDTADPYDPGSYGLGALGLVGDDYDTGDEYPPPDNNEAPGQDSPLSLIRNFGRHPGQRGCRRPPWPIPGWRSRAARTLARRNPVRDRVPRPATPATAAARAPAAPASTRTFATGHGRQPHHRPAPAREAQSSGRRLAPRSLQGDRRPGPRARVRGAAAPPGTDRPGPHPGHRRASPGRGS